VYFSGRGEVELKIHNDTILTLSKLQGQQMSQYRDEVEEMRAINFIGPL